MRIPRQLPRIVIILAWLMFVFSFFLPATDVITDPDTPLFSGALFPALARLGLGPIGALKLDIGPETPAYYLLIPGTSVETLAMLDLRLAEDPEFLKAGDPLLERHLELARLPTRRNLSPRRLRRLATSHSSPLRIHQSQTHLSTHL